AAGCQAKDGRRDGKPRVGRAHCKESEGAGRQAAVKGFIPCAEDLFGKRLYLEHKHRAPPVWFGWISAPRQTIGGYRLIPAQGHGRRSGICFPAHGMKIAECHTLYTRLSAGTKTRYFGNPGR